MLLAFIVAARDDFDFTENVIVYHETEEAAREYGRGCLTSSPNYSDTIATRAPEHDARCVGKTEPEQEDDPAYLRTVGWGYEGERSCDSCGLKAFGIQEYAVCKLSNQCRECGCGEDYETKQPCDHADGFSCS